MNDYKETLLNSTFKDIFEEYNILNIRRSINGVYTSDYFTVCDNSLDDFYTSEITFTFWKSPEIDEFIRTIAGALTIFNAVPDTSSEVETIVCLLNQIKELKEEIARLKDEQSKDC